MAEEGPVELPLGKVVAKRWKIIEKVGEGGCGAVYKVEDSKSHAKAALKAESNFTPGGSVLKLEVQVLRRMSGRKFVAQLIHSGKKERYSYMVMTLLGPSVAKLFRKCKKQFSISTQVRIGIHILYGLKQLHEVGYIHRDIKPANLSIGRKGAEARVVHLLDFGLSREYVKRNNNKLEMRRPRSNTLFRGTLKYCSAQSHTRTEQGRPDDLWSMVYVLAEFRNSLPWGNIYEKKDIFMSKEETTDEKLLANSPAKYVEIAEYLQTLTYYSRPDYYMIFQKFAEIMAVHKVKHSDPFDWEQAQDSAILGAKSPPKTLVSKAAKKIRKKFSNIMTISEDSSIAKSDDGISGTGNKTMSESEDKSESPFHNTDFESNEIGF